MSDSKGTRSAPDASIQASAEPQLAGLPIPTPPKSVEQDYSDAASEDSRNPRPQRRHPRGGRKQKQQESGANPSCCGCEIHCKSERNDAQIVDAEERQPEERAEAQIEQRDERDYDQQELRNARRTSRARKKPAQKARDTGFGIFNLKRAEQSGGRPFGVALDRSAEPQRTAKKSAPKDSKSKAKPRNQVVIEEQDDWDEEEDEEEEDEQEEEPKRQPVNIRLDLNLELEIFLKAKIKGSVEITFL